MPKIGSDPGKVDAFKLWREYLRLGQLECRWGRIILSVILYGFLGIAIMILLDFPSSPIRGNLSIAVNVIVTSASVLILILLVFFVVDGTLLCRLDSPFWIRREHLAHTVEALGEKRLVLSEGITEKGKIFFEEVSARGLEGVVAKRLQSRYAPGHRTDAWLKIKRRERMVCAVLGYVPSGSKGFQSLILASELGGELRCVGRLRRGFDPDVRARLEKILQSRLSDRAFLPCSIKGQWVEPGLYLTVRYLELTARGELRSPVFERICEEDSVVTGRG